MFRNIRFSSRTIPLALLLLAVITYGLLLPWVGFYWDDWPFAFLSHFFGPAEFLPAFKPFRPFLGPLFLVTTSILRESVLGWQTFGLFTRFLTGLVAWWSFSKVWPAHKREILLVALFFLVFPGYGQQWVSFTHTNQELLPLLFYLLSVGVMGEAYRRPARFWPLTLLALALEFAGLFTTEYFFGLEVLRPFIFWFMGGREALPTRKRWIQTLKSWAPYLALWVLNAAWLYLFHRSAAYNSYGITAFNFSGMGFRQIILKTLEDVIRAVAVAGFSSWAETLQIFTQSLSTVSTFVTIGVVSVSFLVVLIYLSRIDFTHQEETRTNWAVQAMTLGLVGILAGRLPSWAAGLPIGLQFSWDRFMLSMMLGASFFFVGLVDYFIKGDHRKTLLVALFIALAVGTQFNNSNTYRREWNNQQRFFWQLIWRIPGIKPGTVLLTHELPFTYVTDFSLTAPINWIYAPRLASRDLPYMLVYTKARLGSALLPSLTPGQTIDYPYRTLEFRGSTSGMVVIFQPVPGCLRVMDPVYSSKETVPGLNYMLTDAIPLSNLSRIDVEAQSPHPSAEWFGDEPAHGWCYYFEKAELARQVGDWKRVVQLEKEAQDKGYAPENPWEMLPFIEGNARLGNLETAAQMTTQVSGNRPDLAPGLCDLWNRVKLETSNLTIEQQDQITQAQSDLKCAQ